ncbi:hypothetical protein [Bifidobacterium felsineum]|uniref:hypothetical protein n=1 Tax=Bifidobacterium felsineum TaxID=2045440 RepID=UPI001BDCAAAC|nr:hypothetical protein [Bifidobacterium felsineum]MBT1164021.1 hypothetical protein [Bifidobacterium felsineum]
MNLSGGDGLKGGRGVGWPLDATKFTPGYYTLSLTEPAGSTYYVGLFASSGTLNGGNRLGYIQPGEKSVRVSVTAAHIAAGLRLGILLYQAGPTDPFGPDTLYVMIQPAGQATAWERPDDTSAGGGIDFADVNYWNPPPLPKHTSGVTFSDAGGGSIRATATSGVGWPSLSVTVELEAGTYTIARTIGNSSRLYVIVTDSLNKTMLHGGNGTTTATLPTGTYTVSVRANMSVDGSIDQTITPVLGKEP